MPVPRSNAVVKGSTYLWLGRAIIVEVQVPKIGALTVKILLIWKKKKKTDLEGQMSFGFTLFMRVMVWCLLQMWGLTEWQHARHTAEGCIPSDVTPLNGIFYPRAWENRNGERHPEARKRVVQAECPYYPWWCCDVWPGGKHSGRMVSPSTTNDPVTGLGLRWCWSLL